VKDRAHLGAECTEDEMQQEAAWYQEPISILLNAMAKQFRICLNSMRWWKADIKE
jgi:hypothetical protein